MSDILYDIVQRLKYKPGWRFEVIPPSARYRALFYDGYLRITWQAIDSYNPERTTTVISQAAIPPDLDKERAVQWIFYMIAKCEDHETREHFEIDGVKIFDPHKKEMATV